ncbi:MAG: ABC transporter substrate-binding protein [Actinomyces sp.]|nr:ABC transporter substrate-binding protein [Actinomyces sp.]MCI1787365.1 ABC transporter substrate-binding protein [Actinomyces sp.]MCI1830817.1 ABC transporter substrate-binding protein [Actinomyces sp.]
MKRTIGVVAMATAAVMGLAACGGSGQSGASGEGGTLEVYLDMSTGSPVYAEMKTLVDTYQQETGTSIDLSIDGTESYEKEMKVRMASSNLPDVFSTHGWSLLRYSPFLEPLTDQSWVKDVNTGLDSAMKDSDGNIYALPIEYTVTGLSVNFDVLEEAGVDPDSIATWDDFDAAAAKVKAAGKTAIACSGKGSGAGNIADFIASGAFADDQLASFTNGDFLSDAWTGNVLDRVADWSEKGYFNPDYSSATDDDVARLMGQGEAAFAMRQPSALQAALDLNPDANIGFIPMPTDSGQGYLVGGEGVNAYGVSKTSENKEAALAFLDFLAQPENATALAEATGTYSGLTTAEPDLGTLQSSYDTWVAPEELPTNPFFDRVYLPNGIWDTMIATTDSVITGQSDASSATRQLADQYNTLYSQNSN